MTGIGKLTFDEYTTIKRVFIKCFDQYFDSIIDEGDRSEITTHLSDTITSFLLHTAIVPDVVITNNNIIFNSAAIRAFHMELLERFSADIVTVGSDVFKRLIESLAEAATACKASEGSRKDGIAPILVSIRINKADIVKTYSENPWLVTLALLNMEFFKTVLGQSIKGKLQGSQTTKK